MIEKLKKLMVNKTIVDIELTSYQATNDILVMNFADGTNIKIMSDPKMCFDGLSFYIKSKKTKTVEVEEEEEIK